MVIWAYAALAGGATASLKSRPEDGKAFRMIRYDLDAVHEECLARQGKTDELKVHLWITFQQTHSAPSLRK